jgi:hypothetical protein
MCIFICYKIQKQYSELSELIELIKNLDHVRTRTSDDGTLRSESNFARASSNRTRRRDAFFLPLDLVFLAMSKIRL